MTRRTQILTALVLLSAACSSADAPPDDVHATGLATPIEAGLYEGSATGSDDSASLAVWIDDDSPHGTLALGESKAFRFTRVDDVLMLVPLAGGCPGCTDSSWALHVVAQDQQLVFSVAASTVSPGFDGLIMVPHDGFKPEFSPAPGIELWTGVIVAASAAIPDAPVLDRDCELSTSLETSEIVAFDCLDLPTDSPWTAEVADSWHVDDPAASFETSGARFVGETVGDRLRGRVLVDELVVGVFEFVR